MDLGLKDKVALVIGGSRGLGYATAQLLAKEGCRIAINSHNQENITNAARKIEAEAGGTVLPLAGDVTDPATPSLLIEQTVEKFGGLDLLFTNAGGPPPGKFESFDDATWQKAIEASLMSHVRMIRCALPYLRQSSAPSVLASTSYSVKHPIPNLILSNSIRLATVGLIKTLSIELGSDGIRLNSILPGWTETERITVLMANRAQTNGTTIEEEIQKQTKETPLGRLGQPEEFAKAAVFLLSPAASFITGVMLTVDGGTTRSTL